MFVNQAREACLLVRVKKSSVAMLGRINGLLARNFTERVRLDARQSSAPAPPSDNAPIWKTSLYIKFILYDHTAYMNNQMFILKGCY